MLEVRDLTKRYGGTVALNGFTLSIAPGEIVGLIGHNGAGKSTFAEIVTGLTRPDSGTARFDGADLTRASGAVRARIGYAPQHLGLYPTATVRANLQLFGRLYGLHRRRLTGAIDRVAHDLGLTASLDRRVEVLSGGVQRRTQAATALLHEPDLLLLDEPTAGADPATRDALLAVVRDRAEAGAAVCYTTHYLPELDQLEATIAVAARGTVIARGDRDTLLSGLTGHATLRYPDGSATTIDGADPVRGLVSALLDGPSPSDVALHQPTIDDLYRHLTGGERVH